MPRESTTLQKWATAEFAERTLAQDRDAYTGDKTTFNYGQWLESVSWFSIGAQIGYFERESAQGAVKLFKEQGSPELQVVWLRWFREQRGIETFIVRRRPPYRLKPHIVTGHLVVDEPATLAIFQAALALSREFRDPCCLNLQRILQSDDNFPDGHFDDVKGAEMLAVLGGDDFIRLESPTGQIAGFLQLIDLLAAFEAISPPVGRSRMQLGPRSVLAKLIGNLLAWRVNLRDEGARGKLAIIGEAFWDLCGKVIQDGLWDSVTSRGSLRRLLVNWRERSDPDEGEPIMRGLPPGSVPRPGTEENPMQIGELEV